MLKKSLNVLAVLFVLQIAAPAQITGGGGVTTTGAITNGHCVSFASATVIQDSGGVCGGTGSSPGGSPGAIQFNSSSVFGGTTLTDLSYSGHTLTLGSTGILNMSAASVTAGVVLPNAAGAAPTTDAVIAFNTTNHLPVFGSNGTTLTYPATVAAVSHQFFTSFTQTTGVFTQAQPAFTDVSGSLACTQAPALTGDTTTSAGSCATTTAKINGLAVPASATVLSSNVSNQIIAAPLNSAQFWVGNGANLPVAVTMTGDAGLVNTGVLTNTGMNGVQMSSLQTGLILNTTGTGVPSVPTFSTGNPIFGNGAGQVPVSGSVTGNTTQVATWTGATTASRCVDTDANGNLHITTADCGSATLPTASAAGQVPVSVGAGTIYAAQTKEIVDVRDYGGTTLCDQINNACSANLKVSLEGLAAGTYACHNVNLENGDCKLLAGSAITLTTDVGFNGGNRQSIEGFDPSSGLILAASANFPLGSSPGAITVNGTNAINSTTLSLAKATGSNIIIKPLDIIAIGTAAGGDTQLYSVTNCTAGASPPCSTTANSNGFGSGYILNGGSTVTVNIVRRDNSAGGLAQAATNGTAVTLGHPVFEAEPLLTHVGDSPNNIILNNLAISCANANSAQTNNLNIGYRVNYAQENTRMEGVYVTNCPNGIQIVSHSANSGMFRNLNVNWTASANCATGPDNGRSGTTTPIEISGAHKTIERVTITSQNCTNTPAGFLIDTAQGGGVSAPGGIKLGDIHFESQTSNSDAVKISGNNSGPVMIENQSGCPIGNPCTNLLHILPSFTGNVIMTGTTPNSGSTNYVKDDFASNTITVANNPGALTLYKTDAVNGVYTDSNPVDVTNGVTDYNGNRYVQSGGATVVAETSAGNITATGTINFRGAAHTGSIQTGLIANIPATCTAGDLYFATDQTHGQSINECYAGNTWVQQLNSGASGANQALSNLSAVAINSSLIPGSDNAIDLGSAALRFRNEYLGGSAIWTTSGNVADTGLCRGAAGVVDVSNGGACAATGNLGANGIALGSSTVPAFNGITLPQIAAPSTPTGTTQDVWADSTDFRLHDLNPTANGGATIGTTVVALANASHKWLNSVGTNGVFTQTQPAISDLTATFTSPVTLSTNTLSISGVTGEQGNGALLQLSTGTVNLNRITKFDTNSNTINSNLLEVSSLVSNAANTATTYSGALDASANAAQASTTFRGGDQTGAGGASSAGGGALIRGGNNAATNAASQAGGIELLTGASTGATQGLQGPFVAGVNYVKGGGTSTLWNLQCGTGAAMTVNDCGASPNNILGVAEAVNANTVVTLFGEGQTFVNASAAVTLNHTVCAGGTAGKVTDSTGTATCTNAQGETVGIVVATSGAWTLPDGVTVTATTTLPLIQFSPGVTIPNTAGSPSLDAVTGSAAQVSRSEVGAGDNYTFNGVETASLTSYITIQDTNSTNNNTSVGLIANCAGTSTGCIGFVTNSVSGTGDLFRAYSGATVTNGTLSGGTIEGRLTAGGLWEGTFGVGSTAHGVLVSEGLTTAAVATAVGATGTVLIGNTGADPSFSSTPTITGTNITGVPINGVVSATGAITTIADGNNPLTLNCAQTTDAQDCVSLGETSAATGGTLTNALANQATLAVNTLTASTATPLEIVQGSITATTGAPAMQVESTWNNASLVGHLILGNVTNTSSASGSNLIDLRVGNTSEVNVGPTGVLQLGNPASFVLGTGAAFIGLEGTAFTGQNTYDGTYANSTTHCLDLVNQQNDYGCVDAASNVNTLSNKTIIGSPAIQVPMNAIGIFNPTALPATFANATQSLSVGTQYGPPGVIDKSIGVTTAAMGAQTSATCTNVNGMSWPLAANKNYLLRCEVPMTLAASATIQYCLGGPGTATSYSLIAEGDLGTGGIWSQISTLAQTAYGTKTGASASVAATSVQHVWAQIQNGSTASGIPLTLQTAANGTNAITVLANASCTLTQEN